MQNFKILASLYSLASWLPGWSVTHLETPKTDFLEMRPITCKITQHEEFRNLIWVSDPAYL